MHGSFCPDHTRVVGFAGRRAPCLCSTIAGGPDGEICAACPPCSRLAPSQPSRSLRDDTPRHGPDSARRLPPLVFYSHVALCMPTATLPRGASWASRARTRVPGLLGQWCRRGAGTAVHQCGRACQRVRATNAARQCSSGRDWSPMQVSGMNTVSTWRFAWASARSPRQRPAQSQTAFGDGHAVSGDRLVVLDPQTSGLPSRPCNTCGVP